MGVVREVGIEQGSLLNRNLRHVSFKKKFIKQTIESISANTYQLLFLAISLKTKFLVNKQLEVSLENIILLPISITKQN